MTDWVIVLILLKVRSSKYLSLTSRNIIEIGDYPLKDLRYHGESCSWTIDIDMDTVPNTLYAGETFSLCFKFGPKYPFDSPEVVFQGDNIPVHPHVYRQGGGDGLGNFDQSVTD